MTPLSPDSLSADTLQLPSFAKGLHTEFLADSLLPADGMVVSPHGKVSEWVGGTAFADDLSAIVFVVCLVLTAIALVGNWTFLKAQCREFFFPLRQVADKQDVGEPHPHVPMTLVMALVMALVAFRYVDVRAGYALVLPWQKLLTFLFFFLLVLAYRLIMRWLNGVMGWLFFAPLQCRRWHDVRLLVTTMEGMGFYAVAVVCSSIHASVLVTIQALLLLVLVARIALLVKAKAIFFTTFYGYLHLLLYLCALETVPLLVTLKIMALFAAKLT